MSGSGVVAPLSYRAQLMREALKHKPKLTIVKNLGIKALTDTPPAPAIHEDTEKLYRVLWDAFKHEFSDKYEDAGQIVCAAFAVGACPSKIAALTKFSISRVRRYGRVLYENGIWTPDGRVSISFDADKEKPDSLLWTVEIILQAIAACEVIVRVRDETKPGVCKDCSMPCFAFHGISGRRCRTCYIARGKVLRS